MTAGLQTAHSLSVEARARLIRLAVVCETPVPADDEWINQYLNDECATDLRAALQALGTEEGGKFGIRFSAPEPWREALEAIAGSKVSPACARIAKAALANVTPRTGDPADIEACRWCARILGLGQPCGRDPHYTPSSSCLKATRAAEQPDQQALSGGQRPQGDGASQ